MQTPAICDKIPPFPAIGRKRARTARPITVPREPPPGCKGGHGRGAPPVFALPRPIPDGPPPISGANKGENAFRSLRPPPGGFGGPHPSTPSSGPLSPGRFGGPAGPPSCNRIARLCPVVQTSRRALTAPAARFTPSQISAFCALPRAALVFAHAFRSLCHLRWQQPTGLALPFGAPSGRFGPSAQQPTGLTLPSGARRAGSLRPTAQTFLTPSAARRSQRRKPLTK